jgi:hypothetical protein
MSMCENGRKHGIDAAALTTPPSKLVMKHSTKKRLLVLLLALFDNRPLGFDE